MRVKGLQDEDFVNYKKPSMFIGTVMCDWKCCNELCVDSSMCQNSPLANSEIIDVPTDEIFRRYSTNPITNAIVVGGLEPFLQFDELYKLIEYFRDNNCDDDFVIYTGYYENEVKEYINRLLDFENIIIKFGRYIPGHERHFDNVLGVYLASNNQFVKKIS